jgi:hypothetical protein
MADRPRLSIVREDTAEIVGRRDERPVLLPGRGKVVAYLATVRPGHQRPR